MQITDGVWGVAARIPGQLRTVNCYLIKDGDDAYMVDTTWSKETSMRVVHYKMDDDTMELVLGLMDEAGVAPRDIKGIVVTHAHPDHMGLLTELQELTGAPALMHSGELLENAVLVQNDEFWTEVRRDWFRTNGFPDDMDQVLSFLTPEYMPIPIDRVHTVCDGDIIPIGSMRWQVVWTPGHSLGQICFYERERGIIMTGDHVLPHDTPIVMCHAALDGIHHNPLGNYINSLEKLLDLPVEMALPGHGQIMYNFHEIVEKDLKHHVVRIDDVINGIKNGARTGLEVACQVPWIGRKKQYMELGQLDRWMAFAETMAHLRELEARGVIKSQYDHSVKKLHWSLV